MKAHASGMRELQLSQLAATRATNPRVKSYAQQLVSEHQQMAQDLKPLLTAAGLDASMPSGVVGAATGSARTETYAAGGSSSSSAGSATDRQSTAAHSSDMAATHRADSGKGPHLRDRWSRMMSDRKQQSLAKKNGADFDKAYINLMVDEHQDAVDLFEDAVEDNPSAQVQSFASKYLPKLQQHLTQAKQLEDAID